MNITAISGRITTDPEVRITQSGKKVCQFCLAVDDDKEDNGQRKTQFLNFVAWENGAAYLERYVKKGNRILVVGRLNKSAYEKNGEKRYNVRVIADRVEFADEANQPKNEAQPIPVQTAPQTAQNGFYSGVEIDADDLPF